MSLLAQHLTRRGLLGLAAGAALASAAKRFGPKPRVLRWPSPTSYPSPNLYPGG